MKHMEMFEKQYGTEEQCLEALVRWRWPHGFRCPRCGSGRHHVLSYRSLRQCANCRRQTSVVAGTILESTKIPLTDWFYSLYLMQQTGGKLTAMSLHQMNGISYNAAWRMKRKLLALMRDKKNPLRITLRNCGEPE